MERRKHCVVTAMAQTRTDSFEQKLQKVVANRFSVALMNNTKWRKVFEIVSAQSVLFDWQDIYPPTGDCDGEYLSGWRGTFHPLDKQYILTKGLGDGGLVGGPIRYAEIQRVVIPRSYVGHDGREKKVNDIEALAKALSALGQIPLTLHQDFVEIEGYTLRR
jgi:hypothetical protein